MASPTQTKMPRNNFPPADTQLRRLHLDECKAAYNAFKLAKKNLVEIQKGCPECLRRRVTSDLAPHPHA